jgi:hypothetical protein
LLPRARPHHGPGPGKTLAHLGHMLAHSSTSIHLHLIAVRNPRRTKPVVEAVAATLAPTTLLPLSLLSAPQRQHKDGATTDGRRHHGPSKVRSTTAVGGATVVPLIGVRTHRWVDAPPSSGSTVVPHRVRAPTACLTVVSHRARDDGGWTSTSAATNPSTASSDAPS